MHMPFVVSQEIEIILFLTVDLVCLGCAEYLAAPLSTQSL
ncbi:uncharacterized protein CTRU02_213023 [Colletotrichum truncatum]|uniref:Uncharacterized protein n=1 Tax=Colletotrichum truncatum TaxID=5467 RepID=A0ACC3YJJ3_COLTU|nr:uncharacterized protein CTRU02_03342 [Colletotrichum truncatum]KAF6797310.1 hypothetical protein CTRU02_03342 [Colletotrichum truncatum]